MPLPALPHGFPGRQLLLALAVACAALALADLIAPAAGLASDARWTPAAGSLVKTARTCPSSSVAAYYDTTCWAVAPDRENPFYRRQGPYTWGQYTYWALELRPDLWNHRSEANPNVTDWTAYTWPRHAALEGLTVDHAPAANAVIVWPQSAGDDTGHVGYVQNVGIAPGNGDELVTLQEMNDTAFDDPSQGQGDTMTLSMDSGDLARVQVIHAPGSSSGTAPRVPAPVATSMNSTPRRR